MRQNLQEQYNSLKRTNRDLKEKLESTEQHVQAFIAEMGTMIEEAEKDPELGMLNVTEMVPSSQMQSHPNATDLQRNNARSGTGGGSTMMRSAQNNSNYTGWGGSGESTGGSARHF